ncbi:hypothetical protein Q0590_25040 [Rhodocytophaga aerolata]|uniref:Uncharacterized protein n=1 Tax=Rhodocytophaga aerolata TaxID=455078 RepID=A0ABT8RBS8_9BACT|nr:hypothetical protein [Rhodocytophaga aerolata]MDO1449567.1 hypothetical protein [Rhodocytophaga aerolata]
MGWLTYDDKDIDRLFTDSVEHRLAQSTLAIRTGRPYCPYLLGNPAMGNATGLLTGKLRAIPFKITRSARILQMGLYLLQGGNLNATKFRFGLYKSNLDSFLPSELLLQTMDITITTYGAEYVVSGMNVLLEAGLYYLALTTDHADTKKPLVFRGFSTVSQDIVLHYDSPSATAGVSRIEAPLTYSASGLPAQFPATHSLMSDINYSPEFFTLKIIAK